LGGGGGGGRDRNNEVMRDSGSIVDVDRRRTQLTIELGSTGRQMTFDVSDGRLMEGLRNGDRIRFEYERRGNDRPVVVAIR
jgi:Cu/Ag efflux protein CusF